MSKYKCKFQKQIDTEKVCEAFEVNRYGDIICQEEDCQLCKLKSENEELREAHNNILTSCKNEQQTNEHLKKVLKDIRAMVDFECECGRGEMCICNVCDKYDAIINKIDGALKSNE